MDNIRVEISYLSEPSGGWNIELIHPTEEKRAWADNGSSAYAKARIIADFYKDDNGQAATIVWLHVINEQGEIVAVNS